MLFTTVSLMDCHQYRWSNTISFYVLLQWDGLPNVLLEVVSRCLPCCASNVGGVAELIRHEKTGFTYPGMMIAINM